MNDGLRIDQTTWEPSNSHGGEMEETVSLPHLTILSHPELERVGERVPLWPLYQGGRALLARNQPEFTQPNGTHGRPLLDPYLSRKPIEIYTNPAGSICFEVPSGVRLKVNGQAVNHDVVLPSQALAKGVTLALENRIALLLHNHSVGMTSSPDLGMVGQSEGMMRLREAVIRAAPMEASVLIRGETGSGKELVAQALHQYGSRSRKPFISVNLATLPGALAASELFGANKGAFTGAAANTQGFFRKAHGGVLFLDEIGEVSPEVQAMLLRALETRQIYPLGSQTPITVDVRLVSATDADLEAQMEEKQFKAPLLHRLAAFEIRIPPLRERRDDISRLFLHFAHEVLKEMGQLDRLAPRELRAAPWMPADLCCDLVRYDWPGNIRQLSNTVRQLMLDNRDRANLVVEGRLLEMLQTPTTLEKAESNQDKGKHARRKPGTVSEQELREALEQSHWEYKACAEILGISRPSLYYLISKFEIPTVVDLDRETIRASFSEHEGDLEAMAQQLQVSKRALKQRLKLLKLL